MNGETRENGLLHILIGDGKGKSSAAAGMALRMAGHGRRVLFTQFLKSSPSGELSALTRISDLIDVRRPPLRHKAFVWNQSDAQRQETAADLAAGWRDVSGELKNPAYALYVFDELLDVIQMGMISEESVIQALGSRHHKAEVVLTGRVASLAMQAVADYITELSLRKHPYERGIQARQGVEW